MTIIDFLEARISEDELAATEGISGQADPENGWGYKGHALTPHVGIIHEAVQAEHIIRWHPARVLAECAAKRAIISLHSPIDPCDAHDEQLNTVSCDTLRTLATIYADHPDYKTEWEL